MTCPTCDTPLPDGARFCPSCGNAVGTSRSEERRLATVLFADVVGFTGLAEYLDPEQVKRIIDGCMERLVDDITSFGGTIDKILGDGVLALFGAPVAHEDDAERAVRAALRMQESIGDFSTPAGQELQLRIGINTGEVLVGALRARSDYTAMGDVVNTAARLQALAPPGRILVGDPTHQLTAESISYEAYGEVVARGREQTVTAWLAVGAISLPGGRRHRNDVPLVGRHDELELLHSGLAFAVGRRRAFLAAVEGEGGVGKSRIVNEIVAHLRDQLGALVLEGACVPYGESNAWWPLASAIVGHLDLDLSRPVEEVRSRAREKGADLFALALDDPDLGRLQDAFMFLLGLPSTLDDLEPVRAREALGRSVIAVLQARLKRGPVALAITDLHWADPAVIALLEQTVIALANHPFVLLTTCRPEADLVWPPPSGAYSSLRLRLEPLDRASAAELARAIVGDGVDDATIDRLYDRSGGNPLFLEELATLVADSGAGGELPDSLRALVSARLDQLPADERAVLDNAAVLGGSGNVASLVRFGEEMGLRNTERSVRHLVDAGLLALENRRWRFRSESVRDVAYQTLTKTARAQRHVGVARAMAADDKGRPEEVAHHFATAAELVDELGAIPGVPADVRLSAVRWLTEAAERAVEQVHVKTAARLTTRGLDLLDGADAADPAVRRATRRLLLLRAETLAELRRLDKARLDVAAAMASASADDDRSSAATGHRLLGEIERFDGHQDEARRQLAASIDLCVELGDEIQLARALRSRGFIEVFGGRPADAAPFLDQADAIYQRLGDRGGHAWIEQNRAWMSFLAGEIDEADRRLHHAAQVMEELGDRAGIGWAFGLLAYVRFFAGNRDEAGRIAETVLRDAAERGDEWAAGMMQGLQANLQLWDGHLAEALRLAEGARSRMRRLGDGYGQIQATAPAVRALMGLGRFQEARAHMEELSAIVPRFGLEAFADLAVLGAALHIGSAERALEAAASAVDDSVTGMTGIGGTDVVVGRALALIMVGRLDEALIALEQAASLDGDDRPYALAVRALVAVADGRLDDALAAAQRTANHLGTTYLDRIYALIAEAAVRARRDDRRAAIVVLEEARVIASGTDDVLAQDLVAAASAVLTPGRGPEPAFPMPGWRRLLTAIFPAAAEAHR